MVNIDELQQCINKLCKERGFNNQSPQTLVLGAMEELGELAKAILLTECDDYRPSLKKLSSIQSKDHSPAQEIGDTITYLLCLCNCLEIFPFLLIVRHNHDVYLGQS